MASEATHALVLNETGEEVATGESEESVLLQALSNGCMAAADGSGMDPRLAREAVLLPEYRVVVRGFAPHSGD